MRLFSLCITKNSFLCTVLTRTVPSKCVFSFAWVWVVYICKFKLKSIQRFTDYLITVSQIVIKYACTLTSLLLLDYTVYVSYPEGKATKTKFCKLVRFRIERRLNIRTVIYCNLMVDSNYLIVKIFRAF